MSTETPIGILKKRLAVGEITIEEYDRLREAISEESPNPSIQKKEKKENFHLNSSILVPATNWRRFLAFAIDHGIVYGLMLFISFRNISDGLIYLPLLYLLFRDSLYGISIGKALLGIRLIDVESLRPISIWAGVKKSLVLYLPLSVLGLIVVVPLIILEESYSDASDVPDAILKGLGGGLIAALITIFVNYYARMDREGNKDKQTLPDQKSGCRAVTIMSYSKAKVEPVGAGNG